jgi:hypothetical protein
LPLIHPGRRPHWSGAVECPKKSASLALALSLLRARAPESNGSRLCFFRLAGRRALNPSRRRTPPPGKTGSALPTGGCPAAPRAGGHGFCERVCLSASPSFFLCFLTAPPPLSHLSPSRPSTPTPPCKSASPTSRPPSCAWKPSDPSSFFTWCVVRLVRGRGTGARPQTKNGRPSFFLNARPRFLFLSRPPLSPPAKHRHSNQQTNHG